MTTQSPPSASDQPPQRSRTKREQVLIACKVCRGRKTKCSGERPRCRQCEMRDQVCEWESLSDEAPKAAQKRKYLDLEQRSASEHELLTYLRTLSETDSLRLTRFLREGFHIDELLNLARELSNVSASERGLMAFAQRTAIEQHDRPHINLPHSGHESESHPTTGETSSSAHLRGPVLPPIASIWQSPEHAAGFIGPRIAPEADLPLSDRRANEESGQQREGAPSACNELSR